ncbi:MAG: dual specificity protein phosphatase family protein [Verrucomicrobiaceae bacterium]|nr:dual specificity protein phosphatase family protein [Verrucomicrobiaceae bacterium]
MNRTPREPGLFWPAVLRLALAGAVFIGVYGACNQLTALREPVPTLMLPWEIHMPFVKEFVVPYWTLDVFFCGAFFLCASRAQLNLLTKRLIAVTLVSGLFYLLFPLKLGFPRPMPEGWTAPWFKALYFNDLPYNLAPSLHISLRSLVWVFYGAVLTGWTRRVVKVWFMLIGASTLLVWQHHLVDVASGFVMGWAIAALIPDPQQAHTVNPSRKLALRYGTGALVCGLLCFVSVLFVWPAVACGILALAYATGHSRLLGKENGTLSPSAEWCLLPVLLVTALVQRQWLQRQPGWREVTDGVFFGRKVTSAEASELTKDGSLAVLDLTAESNAPVAFREHAHYYNLPLLDLVPLKPEHITTAIQIIREQRAAGRRVYLHCQLGLQRSALIAAHWLWHEGKVTALEEAVEQVRSIEPTVVI